MKRSVRLVIVLVFAATAAFVLVNASKNGDAGSVVWAAGAPTPTPTPAKTPAATPAPTTAPAATGGGGGTIQKTWILDKDSKNPGGGPVDFDHENHATAKYSVDGNSTIACVECHHTDQPKSALKPPLVTSERDVALTLESFKASPLKVKTCRECHVQAQVATDDKPNPVITVSEEGVDVDLTLDNKEAYHRNCNVCHDAAAKARPALKSKPGFAVTSDCAKCHKAS